ncbi:LEPR-XLL domain-containing protein [Mucisphaera sp.]|uniref:LEPR-XLL domain-containing protein n=1 Tax=Mucisphaera sp. TaxID=2913024 RepID=UPI003D0E74BC
MPSLPRDNQSPNNTPSQPRLEPLEPRLLLSGTPWADELTAAFYDDNPADATITIDHDAKLVTIDAPGDLTLDDDFVSAFPVEYSLMISETALGGGSASIASGAVQHASSGSAATSNTGVSITATSVTNTNTNTKPRKPAPPPFRAGYIHPVINDDRLAESLVLTPDAELELRLRMAYSNTPNSGAGKAGYHSDLEYFLTTQRSSNLNTAIPIGTPEEIGLRGVRPGGGKNVNTKIDLPDDLTPGSYYVAVRSKTSGHVREDVSLQPITIEAAHHEMTGTVTRNTLPAETVAGQQVRGRVSVAVTNAGNLNLDPRERHSFVLLATADGTGETVVLAERQQRLGALKPGQTRNVNFNVRTDLPDDPATYTLSVAINPADEADPAGTAQYTLTNFTDNVPNTLNATPIHRDLALAIRHERFRLPAGVIQGQTPRVNIPIIVTHQGNVAYDRGQRVEVAINLVGPTGTTTIETRTLNISNLKPGKAKRFQLRVELPANAEAGNNRLAVELQPTGPIAEAPGDAANDADRSFLFRIDARDIDLHAHITRVQLPTRVAHDDSGMVEAKGRVHLTLTNDGNLKFDRDDTATVDLIAIAQDGSTHVSLGSEQVKLRNLGVDRSRNARLQIDADLTQVTSGYTIAARVRLDGLQDNDVSNNVAASRFGDLSGYLAKQAERVVISNSSESGVVIVQSVQSASSVFGIQSSPGWAPDNISREELYFESAPGQTFYTDAPRHDIAFGRQSGNRPGTYRVFLPGAPDETVTAGLYVYEKTSENVGEIRMIDYYAAPWDLTLTHTSSETFDYSSRIMGNIWTGTGIQPDTGQPGQVVVTQPGNGQNTQGGTIDTGSGLLQIVGHPVNNPNFPTYIPASELPGNNGNNGGNPPSVGSSGSVMAYLESGSGTLLTEGRLLLRQPTVLGDIHLGGRLEVTAIDELGALDGRVTMEPEATLVLDGVTLTAEIVALAGLDPSDVSWGELQTLAGLLSASEPSDLTTPSDLNGDGVVDLVDLSLLATG